MALGRRKLKHVHLQAQTAVSSTSAHRNDQPKDFALRNWPPGTGDGATAAAP